MLSYPNSPFTDSFNVNILWKFNKLFDDDESSVSFDTIEKNGGILKWLCTAPRISSFRVNTLKNNPEEVLELIRQHIAETFNAKFSINLQLHPILSDVIILTHQSTNNKSLEVYKNEVIVDSICGASILRGAHIYAPGVIGMLAGTQINDKVSIYADIARKCKRGLQTCYEQQKVFIANGTVKMTRKDLFAGNNSVETGVAIEITENISNCPPFGDNFLPEGSALLQNLPSIVCVHVLNPQSDDCVLDMCAAPGNKTTHIASLMKNKGKLVALDKIARKVEQLKRQCQDFRASNVQVYQADSTKIVKMDDSSEKISFLPETFDKILLDVPCSALGKRPQLVNAITEKVLLSYVPLQRKLFNNAVSLLKTGGTLVYSTCTITVGENEGIVAWALKTFKCLELVKANPYLGGCGLDGTNLTEKERSYVQRFGPNQEVDSVGFFIAKFIKKFKH